MSPFDNIISEAAASNGVPEPLLHALIKQESGYNPNAVSKAGAIGLTQLMPDTAKELGVDPHDPAQNIHGGAKYLADQYKRFGSWEQALQAYNAGPGRVQKGGPLPAETVDYVSRIKQNAGPDLPFGNAPDATNGASSRPSVPYQPLPKVEGSSPTGGPPTDVQAPEVAIYDTRSGDRVNAPHELIPDEVMAGRLGFPAGTRVPVIHPRTGELLGVAAEDAADAFQAGFKMASPVDLYKDALQKAHGTPVEMGKTFLEHGLSSATFGGSSWAEKKLLDNAKEQAGRSEANPGTGMAGDVTGIVGSMALPGPNLVKGVAGLGERVAGGVARAITPAEELAAALAPKAAREMPQWAAALPDLMQKGLAHALDAGKAIQDTAELGVTGIAAKAGRKALARGIQGATEGSLFEAGHLLNQSVIEDPNLTAESIVSQMGLAAALGGAAGFLTGPFTPKIGRTALPVEEGTPGPVKAGFAAVDAKWGVMGAASLLGVGSDDDRYAIPSLIGTGVALYNMKLGIGALPTLRLVVQKWGSFLNQTRNQIAAATNALARGTVAGEAIAVAKHDENSVQKTREVFQERIANIQRLQNNPELFSRVLESHADAFHAIIPEAATASTTTITKAVQFLASKVPQAQQKGPLSPPWHPSATEISNFNKYYDAVSQPLDILEQAKRGTLTPQSVEAVKTVYPSLFSEMQKSVLEKLTDLKGAPVPYRSRMFLSLLLSQDMDGTLNPDAVGALQATFNNKPAAGAPPAAAQKPKTARARPAAAGKMTLASRFTPGSELTGMKRLG